MRACSRPFSFSVRARCRRAQPQDAPPGRPREGFDRSGDGPRGRFRENGPRGRWRDRRGGGEDRPMDRPIPPEMIDKIMELVRDKFPERFDRLADLETKNPRRFEMLIRRMAPVAIEYFKLRERARSWPTPSFENSRIRSACTNSAINTARPRMTLPNRPRSRRKSNRSSAARSSCFRSAWSFGCRTLKSESPNSSGARRAAPALRRGKAPH